MKTYDVLIIGAGSIGVPTALYLSEKGFKVGVIDSEASCGQGQNKKAIGGIRATHSDYAKIKLCQRSIDVFSTWKELYGDDIGWIQNGYSFPAYSDVHEEQLKSSLKKQHEFGLNINWLDASQYKELVTGINDHELRGATYSPQDGSASPLMSVNAFYFRSVSLGATYHFKQRVTQIVDHHNIIEVHTDKESFQTKHLINASGNQASQIGKLLGTALDVVSDSHEGAISEPISPLFKPMIVDMRQTSDSMNCYFYQNSEHQIVLCITPKPLNIGTDSDSTAWFLPAVARRLISIYPKLANLKVRRTWRGQYPMTPDGFPLVGFDQHHSNVVHAVGMCGQGFMLGPGVGQLVAGLITQTLSDEDQKILKRLNPYRQFNEQETFK